MSTIFGLIHADWCGHCQALMPEWNKMKGGMETRDLEKMVEIEAGEDSAIKEEKMKKINDQIAGGDKLSENGYPTIFKVSDKKLHMYDGERSAEQMKQWLISSVKMGGRKSRKMGGRKSRKMGGRKSKKMGKKSRKSRKN